jgi:hypothetical protein
MVVQFALQAATAALVNAHECVIWSNCFEGNAAATSPVNALLDPSC